MKEQPRLHPQSWRELRQLVLLHGMKEIRAALDHIEPHDTGAERYWEGRWRDEAKENDRLRAELERAKA